MAVQTTMTNNYTKPADAIKQSQNSKTSGAIGKTDRGTAIVTANSGMNKDSFLKLLVAQLSNLDPTQDQDSTAYVTQMAEFASIEQLNNLNTTMLDFSHQQMVGQVAILKDLDTDGYHKFGLITQVFKSGTTTYATVQDASTGISSNYEISKIIGTSDSGYTNANFETALNSNFLAASQLASSGAKAVVIDTESKDSTTTDSNGNDIVTTTTTTIAKKCIIKSAYLDKQKSVVNVTVAFLDDDGNETGETKIYDYNSIVIAGDLSDDVMDKTVGLYNNKTKVSSKDKATGVAVNNPTTNTTTSTASAQEDKTEEKTASVTESEGTKARNINTEDNKNNSDLEANSESGKSNDVLDSNSSIPTVENIENSAAYAGAVSSINNKKDIEEENKILEKIAGV